MFGKKKKKKEEQELAAKKAIEEARAASEMKKQATKKDAQSQYTHPNFNEQVNPNGQPVNPFLSNDEIVSHDVKKEYPQQNAFGGYQNPYQAGAEVNPGNTGNPYMPYYGMPGMPSWPYPQQPQQDQSQSPQGPQGVPYGYPPFYGYYPNPQGPQGPQPQPQPNPYVAPNPAPVAEEPKHEEPKVDSPETPAESHVDNEISFDAIQKEQKSFAEKEQNADCDGVAYYGLDNHEPHAPIPGFESFMNQNPSPAKPVETTTAPEVTSEKPQEPVVETAPEVDGADKTEKESIEVKEEKVTAAPVVEPVKEEPKPVEESKETYTGNWGVPFTQETVASPAAPEEKQTEQAVKAEETGFTSSEMFVPGFDQVDSVEESAEEKQAEVPEVKPNFEDVSQKPEKLNLDEFKDVYSSSDDKETAKQPAKDKDFKIGRAPENGRIFSSKKEREKYQKEKEANELKEKIRREREEKERREHPPLNCSKEAEVYLIYDLMKSFNQGNSNTCNMRHSLAKNQLEKLVSEGYDLELLYHLVRN